MKKSTSDEPSNVYNQKENSNSLMKNSSSKKYDWLLNIFKYSDKIYLLRYSRCIILFEILILNEILLIYKCF